MQAVENCQDVNTDQEEGGRPKKIYLVSRQAVVHETVKSLKWKPVKKCKSSQLPAFDIAWIESADLNFYRQVQSHQRVSQTPGMEQLSRKKNLCRNLNAMRAVCPQEYDIFPKTWLLPEEYPSLLKFMDTNPKSIIIVKPDGRCQGRGIYLTSNCADIDRKENQVCQLYLEKPSLINGFKFDLRLYVLITSIDPLRVFVYDDGLVRLCTETYKAPDASNFSRSFMHLTNYAINKTSDTYRCSQSSGETDSGSKWTLKSFFKWLESNNASANVAAVWSSIHQVIAKTVISGSAHLHHQYHANYPMSNNGALSFQLLGFDILLDQDLRPWLIEINRNPSLKCDAPLDHEVKSRMLRDLFAIVVPQGGQSRTTFRDRLSEPAYKVNRTGIVARQQALELEKSLEGGFRLILPELCIGSHRESLYSKLQSENQRIFHERTKQKARHSTSKV